MTLETSAADACTCVDSSLRAGEQLFGTAPQADVWLLLEYRGAWAAKALIDNDLSAAIRAHLAADIAGRVVRTQLIRQPGRAADHIRFYVAAVDAVDSRLYTFDLATYPALLDLDLAAILTGDVRYEANRSSESLFLVCTNGRRDIVCSRHGLPVYRVLAELGGESVWQTTHLGGHRFAATGVSLPDGVVYGRITEADVPVVWEAHHLRQIAVNFYRGRSCWTKPVQAAEYFLRWQTGVASLDSFRLEGAVFEADDRWTVRFAARASGSITTVRLWEEPDALQVALSSDERTPTAVPQFRLESVRNAG